MNVELRQCFSGILVSWSLFFCSISTRTPVHPSRRVGRWTHVLLCALGVHFAVTPGGLHGQPLQVSPEALDFGAVKPGVVARRDLSVRNTSSDEIEVRLKLSGAGFSLAADTVHVGASATRLLPIEFSAADTGMYSGQLELQIPQLFGSQRVAVALSAAGQHPRLTIRPSPELGVDAGPTPVGTPVDRTVGLANAGHVELALDSVAIHPAQGPFSISSASPARLLPGARTEIEVRFDPRAGGVFAARLVIHSADLPGSTLVVPVTGEGLAPRLALSPRPEVGIDFEAVEVGTTSRRVLSLLNQGRSDLELSLQVTEETFATAGSTLTIEPGGRRDVDVSFRPRYEGPARAALLVSSNEPGRKQVEMPITGLAQVTPPRVEILNRTPIHFGSVPVGKPAREHLLLWNRGGSPFTVRMELDRVSQEFELESPAVLLQPGESAKVELTFRPGEIGYREAVLSVDTESGRSQFVLHGTGKFLQLSPSTYDFGRVPVGESSSGVIDLVNIGNADFTINRLHSTSDDYTVYTQVSADSKFLLSANNLRSLPVNVTFAPSARGVSSATLRLEGFWEEGTENMEVLLNGIGVAAEIELHPSGSLDFGYVVLGEAEQRPLVATNTGDTALQVEANPLTSEASVEPKAFALDPGQSITLKVRFSPDALGERFGQILLISNDVRDKAQAIKVKGQGTLESIDLAPIATVTASRGSGIQPLRVPWNNTPLVVHDGTKIDLRLQIPDSLRQALVGRRVDVEWVQLDGNYDPKGGAKQTKVQIYDDSEGSVLAEDLNLRLSDDGIKRVRLRLTTRSYPDAPPQSISQIIEAGGWKWEFEARPLVSFLTIRPGRDWTDKDGKEQKGETERLIGLPGLAFAGWHNAEHPAVSGVHLTATGNVLEALSTGNSIAVSLGVAVSLYKDKFLLGFGWDIYDSRPTAKRRGSQDYIFTFKYSGLF